MSFPQGHFYLCTKGHRPEDQTGRREADIAPADDADFTQAMDDMKRWLDLFNALGVKAGVLHVGGKALQAAGWSAHRIFARQVQALQQICAYAKNGPTMICLENLPADYPGMVTVTDFNRLHAAVGADNLALCLDTGHANLSGVDPAAFIQQAGTWLKALHIADNLGQNDDHLLPYSRGTVRWPAVLRALREVHYDGLFNFEVPGENRCPPPIRLAKLDYARQLADWMIRAEGLNTVEG